MLKQNLHKNLVLDLMSFLELSEFTEGHIRPQNVLFFFLKR